MLQPVGRDNYYKQWNPHSYINKDSLECEQYVLVTMVAAAASISREESSFILKLVAQFISSR